jgi:sodium-dependent dicarboxylate transporter 2/3/5
MPARARVGLFSGPLLLALLLVLPAPDGLSPAGWRTAALAGLMAVWWVTEPVPLAVTSLLPLALLPLLGVADVEAAAAPYANPIVFLFLGGFLLALAMQRSELHRRLARFVLARIGTGPAAVVAGFMAATAFVSLWVSNTATTLLLLPIGLSVVALLRPATARGAGASAVTGTDAGREGPPAAGPDEVARFAAAVTLGIAYAASIGGLGTLVGTPPNALLAGYVSEAHGVELGFARWMLVGIPLVVVGVPLAWLVLVRVVFPLPWTAAPGGAGEPGGDVTAPAGAGGSPAEAGSPWAGLARAVAAESSAAGPASPAERRVALLFTLAGALWISRPLLERWLPGLTDAGIAVAAGLLLFVVPAGGGARGALLDWSWVQAQLPWDVLLLFGGGLSLAAAFESSGLAGWIGGAAAGLAVLPPVFLIAGIAAIVVLLSELASNTAIAALFLPIAASVAEGLGRDPLELAVPAALAASCGFMLPVATPPNAIAYGTRTVTVGQMARAGLLLDLIFVLLVTAASFLLVPVVFGARAS